VAEKEIKRHLDELRRKVASNDVSGFATTLCALLAENFEKWFRIVREQKVLGQLRDLASIREVGRILGEFHPKLSKQNFATIEHHINVCEFMQTVFTQIDKETRALGCCSAHPDNIARAVVSFVEIAHHAFQLSARANADSVPLTITMSQLAEIEGRLRSILDAGNTVLNSTAAKSGFDRDHVDKERRPAQRSFRGLSGTVPDLDTTELCFLCELLLLMTESNRTEREAGSSQIFQIAIRDQTSCRAGAPARRVMF
jgi:hypothetical protein